MRSGNDCQYSVYRGICISFLVMTVIPCICFQPPPLLPIHSDRSITMSQRQAASLLACAFFCLFPYRSDRDKKKEYENYQNPNFDRFAYVSQLDIRTVRIIFEDYIKMEHHRRLKN